MKISFQFLIIWFVASAAIGQSLKTEHYYYWRPAASVFKNISSSNQKCLSILDVENSSLFTSIDSGLSWAKTADIILDDSIINMSQVDDSITVFMLKSGNRLTIDHKTGISNKVRVFDENYEVEKLLMLDSTRGYALVKDKSNTSKRVILSSYDNWDSSEEIFYRNDENLKIKAFSTNDKGLLAFITDEGNDSSDNDKIYIRDTSLSSVYIGGRYSSIHVDKNNNLLVVGDQVNAEPIFPNIFNPILLYSSNLGENWLTVYTSESIYSPYGVYSHCSFKNDTGFVVFEYDYFLRTTNGGKSWDIIDNNHDYYKDKDPIVYDFTIINSHRLAFAADRRMIIWDEFSYTDINEDESESPLPVYPQPASQFVIVQDIEAVLPIDIDIIDISGAFVKSLTRLNVTEGKVQIPTAGLKSGTYFATWKAAKGAIESRKFVVEK